MIVSGEKPEEYRMIKQYWITRLCGKKMYGPNGLTVKPFTHVRFRNGYGKNSPVYMAEIKNITIGEGQANWGAEFMERYFIIRMKRNES